MIVTCLLETVQVTVDLGGSRDRERDSYLRHRAAEHFYKYAKDGRKARKYSPTPLKASRIGGALGAAREAQYSGKF